MTKKKENFSSDDIFKRFSDLMEGSLPEEYKNILNEFYKQGVFYKQFVQYIQQDNKKGDELPSFWDLSDNFCSLPLSDFTSFFDNKACHLELDSFLEKFKNFQLALQKVNEFHKQVCKNAAENFEQMRLKVGGPLSSDKICQMWLQAGQSGFNNISQQPAYTAAKHDLIESLVQLKASYQKNSNQHAELLGIPSQIEYNELKQNLHQLRMEFAEYREEMTSKIAVLTTQSQPNN